MKNGYNEILITTFLNHLNRVRKTCKILPSLKNWKSIKCFHLQFWQNIVISERKFAKKVAECVTVRIKTGKLVFLVANAFIFE